MVIRSSNICRTIQPEYCATSHHRPRTVSSALVSKRLRFVNNIIINSLQKEFSAIFFLVKVFGDFFKDFSDMYYEFLDEIV